MQLYLFSHDVHRKGKGLEGFTWNRERKILYNRNGWGLGMIDNMEKEERDLTKELRIKERDIQTQIEQS